jgi:hypothetical protein
MSFAFKIRTSYKNYDLSAKSFLKSKKNYKKQIYFQTFCPLVFYNKKKLKSQKFSKDHFFALKTLLSTKKKIFTKEQYSKCRNIKCSPQFHEFVSLTGKAQLPSIIAQTKPDSCCPFLLAGLITVLGFRY